MFFSKLQRTDNIVLRTFIRVPMVKYEMRGLAVKYGLSDVMSTIRDRPTVVYGHVLYREFTCSVLLRFYGD